MTAAQTMTIAQIEAQLRFSRQHLAALDEEAKNLSLPVISGDGNAIEALAGVSASIQKMTADIAVLNNAKLAAEQVERSIQLAEDVGRRARHLGLARGHAADIVKLAARADEIIASFKSLIADMEGKEASLRRELGLAKALPETGLTGQHNLSRFVADQIVGFVKGIDKFMSHRPVAEIAANAWGHLLNGESEGDE